MKKKDKACAISARNDYTIRVKEGLTMAKNKSTFDRMMENPEWKAGFEKSYDDFLIAAAF